MGKRKKLLGLVLVVCMLFTLTPITSRADVTTEKWTDFTAADFAGGSGTKDDPYQIATAGQLAKLASEVNSGVPEQTHLGEYFKLTAPIDLSGKRWIPIGYGNASSKAFSGYFDGNNQVITGLYVDERGSTILGLVCNIHQFIEQQLLFALFSLTFAWRDGGALNYIG